MIEIWGGGGNGVGVEVSVGVEGTLCTPYGSLIVYLLKPAAHKIIILCQPPLKIGRQKYDIKYTSLQLVFGFNRRRKGTQNNGILSVN